MKEPDTDIRCIQFKSLVYPGNQGHPILMILKLTDSTHLCCHIYAQLNIEFIATMWSLYIDIEIEMLQFIILLRFCQVYQLEIWNQDTNNSGMCFDSLGIKGNKI